MTSFFFASRRRHTRCGRDWSSDVCSSDLVVPPRVAEKAVRDGGARMVVAHDALARGDRRRQHVLDGMARLVPCDRRIGGGAPSPAALLRGSGGMAPRPGGSPADVATPSPART